MPNPGDDLNKLDLGLPGFLEPAPANEPSGSVPESPSAAALNPSNPLAADPVATSVPSAPGKESSTAKVPSAAKAVAGRNPQAPAAKPASATNAGKPSATAKAPEEKADTEENPRVTYETNRRGSFWSAIPSWGISTAVHVAAILALAAWNIEPIQKELKLLLTVGDSAADDNALEDFAMDSSTAELQSSTEEETPTDAPAVESSMVETKVEFDASSLVAAASEIAMPSMSQSLAPSTGIAAQSNAALRAAMSSRSKESKREMLKKYGGTTETERAVAMALKWLAEHQNPETGAWTLSHSLICQGQCDHPGRRPASLNAATGLALMCFLGAGQTHLEGEYKDTVFKGLSFLIQSMRVQGEFGSWYRGDGHGQGLDDMYAHGIAAIAMCEAYGMTHDERLLEAAQLSINYMTYAQNPNTGGWHYSPFPLGSLPGDTSVVGWQMMAIKSAAMAGLNYDIETVRKANFFLDSMMVPSGFGYHYSMDSKVKSPLEYRAAMTACGVLCRMYAGWSKDEPTIKAAVEKFKNDGPSPTDSYYNYYATQVMKQYGGPEWDSWNNRMRDLLLSSQVQSGHGAGSWYVDEGLSSEQGGRLYVTCMKTMMLEVYYRYMPLYAEQKEEDKFEL